ncbi:MAG: transglycosylase domain-containing protein, partial [Lentisphaeria bacterium]|nr:transglycosylase domain-containing protein [Lentisphaeria bacterium]
WLHVRRTCDAQWRFELELNQISPAVIRTLLAVEDRNFYRHNGVDWSAALRAFSQNLRFGRIISGASTISMQLAGMTQTGPRRSLKRKIKQIIKARRLEQLYSKDRILKEYLNRLPFGGKIFGIEAAAQYYFGQRAADLNRSEAALLCGLPQRPNAYRPDRFLKFALNRRDRVLKQLEHLKQLAPGERHHIRRKEPLRFREYRVPAEFQLLENSPDRMYFDLAAREAGSQKYRIVCAYHAEASRLLRHALVEQCRSLPGVQDAAGVLIENETGSIIALTGTIAPPETRDRQVNAAVAVRSAGSTLKPFLYAEAVSGGLLTADTILKDLPIRRGSYSPGNYDGIFRGEVRAQDALADSLNTPAVRLAEELGMERILTLLRRLNLIPPHYRRSDGLSITLGSAGHTLLDLTAAYRVFSLDGCWTPATFLLKSPPRHKVRIFAPGTGVMIARMLKRRLPGTSGKSEYAWKTGTSNGNHDAWCFAFSADHTIGVWFGNKNGRAASSLVGVKAAAPAAGRILESMNRFGTGKTLPDFPERFRFDRLCSLSGLRATPYCQNSFPGYSLREAPLRPCRNCPPGKASRIRILSPSPGTYLKPANGELALRLQASGKKPPHWFLNGCYLGCFMERKQIFNPGTYCVKAISEDAEELSAQTDFSIVSGP